MLAFNQVYHRAIVLYHQESTTAVEAAVVAAGRRVIMPPIGVQLLIQDRHVRNLLQIYYYIHISYGVHRTVMFSAKKFRPK